MLAFLSGFLIWLSTHQIYNQHNCRCPRKLKHPHKPLRQQRHLQLRKAYPTSMYTTAILLAGLSALAAASPISIPKPESTGVRPPFPMDSGSPPATGDFPFPTGAPRPTAVPVPRPIGSATCPTNGQLVCNGPNQWGLCNWGQVQFQKVAAGTQCLGGEIVFAPGFGTNA